MDIEDVIVHLIQVGRKSVKKGRMELIDLIEDYFGKDDALLVLMIALYFKNPGKFGWLEKEIRNAMEVLD